MDWPRIVIAAGSGAIAAAIAGIALKNDAGRGRRGLVTGLAFIALFTLGNLYVLPELELWRAERDIQEIRFYRVIATSDPATYQKIRAVLKEASGRSDAQAFVTGRVASIVASSLPQHVAKASDESLIDFARASIGVMDLLNSSDANACYQFLFPKDSGDTPSLAELMNTQAGTALLDSMAEIYQTAAENPHQEPDSNNGERIADPLYTEFAKKHGKDVLLLTEPQNDPAQRKRVCELGIDLYDRIVELPPSDAGAVLRYMLAKP